MSALVVGVGQPFAGDDGVGLAVTARLRAMPDARALDIVDLSDVTLLTTLLEGRARVIVVDALASDGAAGAVRVLAPEDARARGMARPSSHAVGVAEAIAIARALYPSAAEAEIALVAVTIAPPLALSRDLSPAVAAAVDEAARTVLSLAHA